MADTSIELISNLESVLHEFPIVRTKSEDTARAIAEQARLLAPVDTGRYRDGIIVQPPASGTKGVARVLATDQKSSWVEFGNAHQSGQFVIRTAVEMLGLSFIKKGA